MIDETHVFEPHFDRDVWLYRNNPSGVFAPLNVLKLFSDPSFFDPSSRSATIRLAQTSMGELVWAEEMLLALYDKHLPVLRVATGN